MITPKEKSLEVYTSENAIKWNSNGGADCSARPWVVQRVAELAKEGKTTLLDIGSGTGRWTKQFAQYVNFVVGIDLSKEMIKIAQETNPAKNIEYIFANFLKSDFKGCDLITALASLQHFKTRDELNSTYEKIAHSLNPRGHFLFYAPHPLSVFAGKTKMYDVKFDKRFSYNDNFPFISFIKMEDGSTRKGSGYHHSMAEYVGDLTQHGFRINKMEEFFVEGEKIPNALVVDAVKIGGSR